MDPDHLEHWFKRLLPRSGRYIIGGVGRSGLVARAFEMRLTHLNKISYWERDFNTPSFQIGDVYIPITGIGNTYEALEGTVTALNKGADVMPITANPCSRQVSILKKHGGMKDIAIIPVTARVCSIFSAAIPATTTWLMSDFTKFRLSNLRDQCLHIHQFGGGCWRRVSGDRGRGHEKDACVN